MRTEGRILMLDRTNPTLVLDVRADAQAPPNPYPQGYGPKVPSRYWLRYLRRWRRVWMACYGNSGSAYVVVDKTDVYLDNETESRLEAL